MGFRHQKLSRCNPRYHFSPKNSLELWPGPSVQQVPHTTERYLGIKDSIMRAEQFVSQQPIFLHQEPISYICFNYLRYFSISFDITSNCEAPRRAIRNFVCALLESGRSRNFIEPVLTQSLEIREHKSDTVMFRGTIRCDTSSDRSSRLRSPTSLCSSRCDDEHGKRHYWAHPPP